MVEMLTAIAVQVVSALVISLIVYAARRAFVRPAATTS
jgi:hypothetical protein